MSILIKRPSTPRCNRVLDKAQCIWTNAVVNQVMSRATKLVTNFRFWRRGIQEPQILIRAAARCLRRYGMALLPNDKEPGMSVMQVDELHQLKHATLGGVWYQPATFYDHNRISMINTYCKLVKRVAALEEEPGLANSHRA